jgi:hypothetical protein
MSKQLSEAEIGRFLASNEPEVMCLKGKWGVGKTYAWTQLLSAARDANNLMLSKYSYVSMFGINSLDQFKLSIVENTTVRANIGKDPSFEDIFQQPRSTAKMYAQKALPFLSSIPLTKDVAALIQQSSFLMVKEQLICIDDLERKGQSLDVKDVLGIIALLKEQRRCKIVIILNEGAFPVDEALEFQSLFEKVVDSHVTYAPSPEEAGRLALPGNSKIDRLLRECFLMLELDNIRVMRRIERLSRMMAQLIEQASDDVSKRLLGHLALLGWSHYGAGAPKSDFFTSGRVLGLSKDDKATPEELQWRAIARRFSFYQMGDLEKLLQAGIERGYFDVEQIEAHVSQLEASYSASRSKNAFHEPWEIYHGSFSDNEVEFVSNLTASFKINAAFIDVVNANSTIVILRELAHDVLADEMIDLYLAANPDQIFDRRNLFANTDLTDPKFEAAFDARAAQTVIAISPQDVLKRLAKNKGMDRADVTVLKAVTSDELEVMFLAPKEDEDLVRDDLVNAALRYDDDLRQKAVVALKKIGKSSKLNALRIRKFGIREM